MKGGYGFDLCTDVNLKVLVAKPAISTLRGISSSFMVQGVPGLPLGKASGGKASARCQGEMSHDDQKKDHQRPVRPRPEKERSHLGGERENSRPLSKTAIIQQEERRKSGGKKKRSCPSRRDVCGKKLGWCTGESSAPRGKHEVLPIEEERNLRP